MFTNFVAELLIYCREYSPLWEPDIAPSENFTGFTLERMYPSFRLGFLHFLNKSATFAIIG